MKKKVIFFGDASSYISFILFKKFLTYDNEYELLAVVNTTPEKSSSKLFNLIAFCIKKLFNPFDTTIQLNYASFINLVPKNIKVIHANNVNEIEFIKKIKRMNTNYAFLMGCPQIFKTDLINCFDNVVNYHNSFLPNFRGLNATAWAMTYEEKYTGFTFHFINENIDDGNIILQERLELDYSKSAYQNGLVKTKKAEKKMKELLKLVFEDFEGYPQLDNKSYFGQKQKKELLTYKQIEDAMLIRRLIFIWGSIELTKNGETLVITKITSNGKIKRIKWMPPKIYGLFRFFYKRLQLN